MWYNVFVYLLVCQEVLFLLKKKDGILKYTGMFLFAMAVFCVVRSFMLCGGDDIWYDEVFTIEFCKRPLGEMISLAAKDVHPPLYYIITNIGIRIINAVSSAFGLGNLAGVSGSISIITAAKIMSVIPFALMLVLGITIVRKEFGWLTCGIFSFAVMTMPQLPSYTVEIRMYGWAMFFVTAASLSAYMFFMADRSKKDIICDGIFMIICGVSSCYTHYYACIAIFALYLLMLLYMIRKIKTPVSSDHNVTTADDSSCRMIRIGMVFITSIVIVISYIPWLGALASQVSTVKSSYWIQPLTWRSLGGCVKFLFRPDISSWKMSVIFAVILFFIYASSLFYAVAHMKKGTEDDEHSCKRTQFAIICFMIMIVLIICGFVLSIMIRPVFVYRYMIPACGVWWLAFAILIGDGDGYDTAFHMSTRCLMMVFFVVIGFCSYHSFVGNEQYKHRMMAETDKLYEEIEPGTRIVCNFDHIQAISSYMLDGDDNKVYLLGDSAESLISEMLPSCETVTDDSEIRTWLRQGGRVLFFGSFDSRDDILAEWKKEYGIDSKDIGSYMNERYWFDVYELSIDGDSNIIY